MVHSVLYQYMSTQFQNTVYSYLRTIPAGEVRTYKEVAIAIKSPRSYRAVATACAKNPNLVTTPCHRIIRSDGGLGGYSGPGGLATKRKLLLSEGVKLDR